MKNKIFLAKMSKLKDEQLKKTLTKLWKNDWNISSISINEWQHLIDCSLNNIEVTEEEADQLCQLPYEKIFLD